MSSVYIRNSKHQLNTIAEMLQRPEPEEKEQETPETPIVKEEKKEAKPKIATEFEVVSDKPSDEPSVKRAKFDGQNNNLSFCITGGTNFTVNVYHQKPE